MEENVSLETQPISIIPEKAVAEAAETIEARMRQPEQRAAEGVGELSMMAQIKGVWEEHKRESWNLAKSTLAAVAAGTISLVPVMGGLGEMVGAGAQEMVKGKNPPNWLTKMFGEDGAKKITGELKKLDVYPNIPGGIVVVAGAAQAAGLEGAGAIPAALQLMANGVKGLILEGKSTVKVAEILVRGAAKAVNDRLNIAASPGMAAAGAAFT